MHDSEDSDTKWRVSLSRTAGKKSVKLPENVRLQINLLMREIEQLGPIRKNWPNFGALTGKGLPKNAYHCHIKKGKPTYVACWYVENKKVNIVEIFYVGSHENAPY